MPLIARQLTDEITIVRAPITADRYNNRGRRQRDWPAAQRHTEAAHVQPETPSEPGSGDRDTLTSSVKIWVLVGADVLATDRIEWDGATWEVDGDLQRWRPPRRGSRIAHAQLRARKVTG